MEEMRDYLENARQFWAETRKDITDLFEKLQSEYDDRVRWTSDENHPDRVGLTVDGWYHFHAIFFPDPERPSIEYGHKDESKRYLVQPEGKLTPQQIAQDFMDAIAAKLKR